MQMSKKKENSVISQSSFGNLSNWENKMWAYADIAIPHPLSAVSKERMNKFTVLGAIKYIHEKMHTHIQGVNNEGQQ